MTGDYYRERLAAERLRRCYELAPPRIRQYLDAEIEHVLGRVRPGDAVLELGCGFGRVLERLCPHARRVVGVDISAASLAMARRLVERFPNLELCEMDAQRMTFPDATFQVVACIQNGISAFHVDGRRLLAEAVRVTVPGGRVLFSSYAARFWGERLAWFRLQAQAGLVGELDEERTRNGRIVSKNGFSGTTFGPADFRKMAEGLDAELTTAEVDGSSLFCELVPR